MRHRVASSQFNRHTNARKGLLVGLLRNLAEQGSITTTQAKAKEVSRLFDKVMTRAKGGTTHDRRVLHETFGKRDVVNTLVDKLAPALAERSSGFTTLSLVGKRRGDNALLVKVSLVDMPDSVGSLRKPIDPSDKKAQKADKKSGSKSDTKAVVSKSKDKKPSEIKSKKSVKSLKKS